MVRTKHEIRYSDPVEEIMGNPPSALVRRGISIFAIVFIIILILSFVIKFPYVVRDLPVEITTDNPPASLVAKVSGKIDRLFVNDGEVVQMQKILAQMESTASFEDVQWLFNSLDSLDEVYDTDLIQPVRQHNFIDDPELGEIQESFSTFIKSYNDYMNHIIIDYYGNKIIAVRDEIKAIEDYISQLDITEDLYLNKVKIEKNKYDRISKLHSDTTVSEQEWEISQQNLIVEKIKLEEVKLERGIKRIDLANKNQELQDYSAKREEDRNSYKSVMDDAFLKLKARVDWWMLNYLIISPIDGRVTFTEFWSENQIVNMGETVMTIVPPGDTEIIARVKLGMRGSGKVEIGDDVNIKLEAYPHLEFGMIRGRVRTKSLVPQGDSYIIDVELPDGLRTFYNKDLYFTQNMSGKAEIITDDMILIERLIYPFKFYIEKNKR